MIWIYWLILKHILYISNKIKGEVLLDTIIHEGVHVMFAISGLGCIIEDVHDELEESLVRAYENIVTPFLKEQYKEFHKKWIFMRKNLDLTPIHYTLQAWNLQ